MVGQASACQSERSSDVFPLRSLRETVFPLPPRYRRQRLLEIGQQIAPLLDPPRNTPPAPPQNRPEARPSPQPPPKPPPPVPSPRSLQFPGATSGKGGGWRMGAI